MKKLYHQIRRQITELSLEKIIFYLTVTSGILMSVISLASNIALDLGIITVIIPLICIVLGVAMSLITIKTHLWFVPSIIYVCYAVFILFPSLWFSTGGAIGSTMPYLIMAGFIIVIMYKGWLRNLFLVTIPLVFSVFIYLEMLYPDICVPYPSREAHYIDLIMGLVISYSVTVMLAIVVLSRYRSANSSAEELVDKLTEVSVTDPLTGIFNRRKLTLCLDEEMRSCIESGRHLTVCLVDIDHFKRINDTFGHLTGDAVLVELTQLLSRFMGTNDVLGRYGGEEFLVILKNQALAEAMRTVESFHRAVEELDGEATRDMTISCGVTEFECGMTYADLLRTTDECLYKAKETGRNKIVHNRS